jgi:hypothetical protein
MRDYTQRENPMRERHKSCDECKPSKWIICRCGRYYCKHNGRAVCWHCLDNPTLPEAVQGGYRCTMVWRTEYGMYRHQTNPGYYRRKDGKEWQLAAEDLGYCAHLIERAHYSKWRDWYGRPCGYSDPQFELWVELSPGTPVDEVKQEIKARRSDKRIEDLMPRLRKPRSEWTYDDHETYHRMMGTL